MSWDLGGEDTKASVSDFRGKKSVNLRKYYKEKSGEWKPTKKGINLTKDQFKLLVDSASLIDENF